jgi:hypothetical protein
VGLHAGENGSDVCVAFCVVLVGEVEIAGEVLREGDARSDVVYTGDEGVTGDVELDVDVLEEGREDGFADCEGLW